MSTPVPGPVLPPCDEAWISGDDLLGCVDAASYDAGTRAEVATIASMVMFEASGRRFPGLCGPVTVRPCRQPCSSQMWGFGGWQVSWGYWASGDWGYDWGWGSEAGGRLCSCGYDSYVELAGTAREITQVMLNGAPMPTTFTDGSPTYRLDEWRYLTRLTDPASPDFPLHWPRCQLLDLPDTSPGTYSVSYTYGVGPPPGGIEAAKQLGCQLLLAKSGKPCQLPANVVSMARQGNTIQRVTPLAQLIRTGATGLTFVDTFVGIYNPSALKRSPAVFSPDTPFPRRVGNE